MFRDSKQGPGGGRSSRNRQVGDERLKVVDGQRNQSKWGLNLRIGQAEWLAEKSHLTKDVSHREGTATVKL